MDFRPIKEKFEDVIKTLQAIFDEAENLDKKMEGLVTEENRIRKLEKTVFEKQKNVDNEKEEIRRNEANLLMKRSEIFEKEKQIEKDKNKIDMLASEVKVLEAKKNYFTNWETSLKSKEVELANSERFDLQRKRELNTWGRKLSRMQSDIIKEGHPVK